MDYKSKIAIIIPSLEPDNRLIKLIEDLGESGFKNLIILNDGSGKEYDKYFETAEHKYNCIVLRHAVNQGKGRALKTLINYILVNKPDIIGAVTVDSDGQHKIEDIEKCCEMLVDNFDSFIMGCRTFSDKSKKIPFRSRFGNTITHKVLKMLCGIDISDTQTGLRGFSRKLMNLLLEIKGERFEYEMNMIIDVKENAVPIKEIKIDTVYIEENKGSHFNPLIDSLKIYSIFFKFLISSFTSFLVDIILFSILTLLLKSFLPFYIIVCAYTARAVSAVINYKLNKNKVFKSSMSNTSTAIKYIILCIVQATISGFSTKWIFGATSLNITIIKVVVDIIIFLISFQIQKGWVFKK